MKKRLFISVITMLLISSLEAKYPEIELVFPYVYFMKDLELKSEQRLKDIGGLGIGTSILLNINQFISIGIDGGYNDMKVKQDNVVEHWDWKFWDKFYADYIYDLQKKDSTYKSDLTPYQGIYNIPIHLMVFLKIPNRTEFTPYLSIGGGVYFYERNLWLEEKWSKYYPEKDYTFNYSFNNYAEVRKGKVLGFKFGIGTTYSVSEHLNLNLFGEYHQAIEINNFGNYDQFPLCSFFNLSVGLSFLY
jgi:opacity protein-like surface antigen